MPIVGHPLTAMETEQTDPKPGTSLADTLASWPSRVAFVAVALVQIAVEMTVTAARRAWADSQR